MNSINERSASPPAPIFSLLFIVVVGWMPQMGQEVQVRISDINTDNNTVNLSMVPAGAYDDRSGGGYGEKRGG